MSHQNIRPPIFGVTLRHTGAAEMLGIVPEESIETDVPSLAGQINDLDDLIADFVSTEVTVEDLLNSTDFLDEQKRLLLEFEARRNEEKHDTPTPARRSRRGRSSIGVKISCPICLESLNTSSSIKCGEEKMVTECGHMFCKSCIEEACDMKKGGTLCPVCRKQVGQLRKIFL